MFIVSAIDFTSNLGSRLKYDVESCSAALGDCGALVRVECIVDQAVYYGLPRAVVAKFSRRSAAVYWDVREHCMY
jgi:hypothetical protein